MDAKLEKVLEFDKIKERLAKHANNSVCEFFSLNLKAESEFEKARQLLEQTKNAIELHSRKSLPNTDSLIDIRDYIKLAQKGGRLNISQIYHIGCLLEITHSFKKYFEDLSDTFFIENFILEDLKDLRKKIKDVFLDENDISDDSSIALLRIRRDIIAKKDRIKSELEKYVQRHAKYLQEVLISKRGEAYVIPVKAEYKRQVKGIVRDTSSTGSTFFIEPNFVVELGNEIARLQKDEEVEIQRILMEFSEKINENGNIIWNNYKSVSEIDFIFAKADFALEERAFIPNINDKKHIKIVNGRHPLIPKDAVVPISLDIGDGLKTLVITGPNTGGKTVTLKTVGLFCMMAASGLAIPADSSSDIPIFGQIFADIGDEQSIEQNLSTFSSHIKNISGILKKVDTNSLVLLDELGAGTDPDEGAALAVAILEYVKGKGAITLATTHYSQLKLYGMSTEGVQNAACEFDIETLRPTYKLLFGIPGKSNAFAISSRLGIFPDIIVRAKEELNSKQEKFEKAVRNLHSKTQKLTNLSSEQAKEVNEAEKIRKEYEDKLANLNNRYDNEIKKAKDEAKGIIKRTRSEAEDIISELKMAKKQSDVIKARERLNREMEENEGEIHIPDGLLGKGKKLVGDDGNRPKGGLPSAPTNGAVSSKRGMPLGGASPSPTHESLMELDLRGKYALDAVMDAESFIDSAVMRGIKTISIIHGKGTGALRSAVHEMLKNNKSVKSFRLGTFGEGENGVSIVELK